MAGQVVPTDPGQFPNPNPNPQPTDYAALWADTIASMERGIALQNQQKIQQYHNAVLAVRNANIAHALHNEPLEPDPAPEGFKLTQVHEDVLWSIFAGATSDWSKAVTADVIPPVWTPPAPTPAPLQTPVPVVNYPGYFEVPGDNPGIVVGTIRTIDGARWMKTVIPGLSDPFAGGPVTAWVKLS